ncbi:hypothetical protein FO519_002339 [Halicephalobus sp. NKZ332]|nr:hypothetical protein FO519_002339 [Halicephalobus sp. NKZ332]
MNRQAVFAILGFAIAVSAMPFDVLPGGGPGLEECELCTRVIGAAERHFHNNVTTQDRLKRELDRECVAFSHTHNQNVSKDCIAFVDANIATIFTEISAGKRPWQICQDIGVCHRGTGGPTGGPSSAPVEAEELPQHDPCHTCNFIIGRAEHHFRPNETSDQLKANLDRECQQLAQWQGNDTAAKCQQIVDANIQTIYNDIKAGKRPYQVCIDLGECTAGTGNPPTGGSFIDVFPPAPDACRTCEFLIGRAEHHMHGRNVTDKDRLERELEHECIQLAHVEGDQAAIQCLDLVRQDIDIIFNDVQAHKHPRQICQDIGECPAGTGQPFTSPPATGSY